MNLNKTLFAALSVLLISYSEISSGQTDGSESSKAEPLPAAGQKYLLPDLRQDALVIDGKRLWFKPIIAVVTDYNWLWQDEPSLEQVGLQENTFDLRAARFGLNLRSKGKVKWVFTFTFDYQESRTRDDAYFQVYDFKLDIPVGPVKITLGKQKEPFSYEMVGLMPQLPQQERLLSPFFITRNTGIMLSGTLANERMTWAAGAFNDWIETGEKLNRNATNWVGRISGLVTVSEDNLNYLHLGLGGRLAGSDDGMMRFSGRPSSNVTDKYVDTKSFAAENASEMSLEAVYSFAPFMLQAEYIMTWVNAPESGNPVFSGAYLSASWVITGESRPYIRSLGYAGGIVPSHRYGAFEVVGRYGYVNLTDGIIDGGIMTHWYFGANWWASRQWKVGLSYGNCTLDRDALTGKTRMLQARLLFMY